jgi:hypothetical protein
MRAIVENEQVTEQFLDFFAVETRNDLPITLNTKLTKQKNA